MGKAVWMFFVYGFAAYGLLSGLNDAWRWLIMNFAYRGEVSMLWL